MLYTRPQLDLAFDDLDEVLHDEPLDDLLRDLQIEKFALEQFYRRRIKLFEMRHKPVQLSDEDKKYLSDMWIEGFITLLFLKEIEGYTWSWINSDCFRRLQARYQPSHVGPDGEFLAAVRNRTYNNLHERRRPTRVGQTVDKTALKKSSLLGAEAFMDGFGFASEHHFTERQ